MLAGAAAGACSRAPTPDEFRRLAETSLSDEAALNGVQLRRVTCEQPGNTQVGTVFTCTAAGEADEQFEFTALIDAPGHVVLEPAG